MAGAFLDRVSNKALGQLLIEKGALTSGQVEEALNVSKDKGIRLGEALVSLGYISRDALGYAIGEQYGLKPMELHPSMVDPELIAQFDPELLKTHLILPLIQIGDELVVVVSDPNDQSGLAKLAEATPHLQVTPQLGATDQIKRCLAILFEKSDPLRTKVPTGSVTVHQVTDDLVPESLDETFFTWLADQAVIHHPAGLQLRKSEKTLLVTVGPKPDLPAGEPLEPKTIASLDWPGIGALQQRLNYISTAIDFTNNRVSECNQLFDYNGELYQVLTYSFHIGRNATYILRAFQVAGLSQTAPTAKLTSGQVALVSYSGVQELESGISTLLSSVSKEHVTLYSRVSSSRHYPAVLNLPAPGSNMTAAMLFTGGTCAVWDWVPEADDVARIMSDLHPAPAIFVFSDKSRESYPGVSELDRQFDLHRVDVSELANYLTRGTN